MDDRCYKHPFEPAEGLCKNCGWEFCTECLVFAFGPKQPPLCLSCALAKSGVRSNAAMPPARSKREIRKAEREFKKRQKSRQSTEPVVAGGAPAPESSQPIDLDIPEESSSAFAWADDEASPDSDLVSF